MRDKSLYAVRDTAGFESNALMSEKQSHAK